MFSGKTRLAYLAGIVDGEGCISIRKWIDKRIYVGYSLMLDVANTKPELVEWIKANFGGTISYTSFKNPNHNDRYVWRISHGQAEDIIKRILPFLIIKKPQAALALRFRKTFQKSNTKGLAKEIGEYRDRLIDELHKLNKKGTKIF